MAALKKMLFGAQEQSTAKYKKEGVLSPKHTHPSNMSFESGYKFSKESSPFYRENSPNVNNNNGSDVEQATPTASLANQQTLQNGSVASAVEVSSAQKPSNGVPQEGLYDPPWETSAVSKFKVIGRMRVGSAGSGSGKLGKDRTPPPVSPKTKKGIQFGEVSTTETPIPGSMELRNVHSLERSKLKKERQERQKQRQQQQHSPAHDHSYSLDRPGHKEPSPSPPGHHSLSLDRSGHRQTSPPSTLIPPPAASLGTGNEDSLLASITDTLQKQSKYGSDTLLSPPTSRMSGTEQQKITKKVPNEVRMSSRGELEKIRAAHRREPPPPPMGVASSVTPPTCTSPQGTTPTHSSPQGIGNNVANRTSPQGAFTAPVARTSPRPQPYMIPMMSSRNSPPQQKGAPPTNSTHQNRGSPPTNSTHRSWMSPSHSASSASPKQLQITPLHSSQILISPGHNGSASRSASKRRMFSGRPRMAASLDELQTDPSIQVTYDASSKSHIFRSLV